MTLARRGRFALAALLFLAPFTFADSPSATPAKWETIRTTSPESVDELKSLQASVKDVTKKATPCTVGLVIGNGSGSGVIVSEDGLVLTAAHVIAKKPRVELQVVLSNGKVVKGVTLGMDEGADSGMIRITDKPPADFPGAKDGKWPYMEVGKSADLKKGQWVVSLGHPGGPKTDRPPPVRTGRFVSMDKGNGFRRADLITTDGTLVGGDSGGPLFDMDGKVVGIHSQIGWGLDMNMHVPADKFKDEWARLLRGDLPGRKLAVAMNVVFDDKAKADGAKLEEVLEGGVAETVGMLAGDVITSFDGNPVKSADDLRDMLTGYEVGQKVKVELLRDGEKVKYEVKLVAKK